MNRRDRGKWFPISTKFEAIPWFRFLGHYGKSSQSFDRIKRSRFQWFNIISYSDFFDSYFFFLQFN